MARKTTHQAADIQQVIDTIGIEIETVKATRTRQSLTLLKAFELLLDMAENSKLAPSLFTRAKKLTDFIGRKLGLTPIQAVLLAIILNGDRDERVELGQISRMLGCNNLRLSSTRGWCNAHAAARIMAIACHSRC